MTNRWLKAATVSLSLTLIVMAPAAATEPESAMRVPGVNGVAPQPAPAIGLVISVSSIVRTGPGAWRLTLAYALTNQSGATIYAEEGPRMPYAAVPSSTKLATDMYVLDPEPSDPYMFEIPDLVAVPHRGRKSGTINVDIPVRASDHFNWPSLTLTPLNRTFTATLRVGYLNVPFTGTGATVLPKFLVAQQSVVSNAVSVTLP